MEMSESAAVPYVISLIIGAGFIAGIIILQIYLSKRESKWFGLILPILSFLSSILIIIAFATFSVATKTSGQTITPDGIVVEEIVEETVQAQNIGTVIFQVASIFILCSIPTVILLFIYFGCRHKLKKNNEINKMNIQDLE